MRDMAKHRGGGVSKIRRPDGTTAYRARLRTDAKTISLGIYDERPDAERAVSDAKAQLGADDVLLVGAQTLSEWGLEWLRRREEGGIVKGVAQERSVWRTHIADAPFAAAS